MTLGPRVDLGPRCTNIMFTHTSWAIKKKPTCFCMYLHQKSMFLMRFSLWDLGMNNDVFFHANRSNKTLVFCSNHSTKCTVLSQEHRMDRQTERQMAALLNAPSCLRYDIIHGTILTCAQKLTWVSIIYHMEPKNEKNDKIKKNKN